jgi:hypothetical protein
MSIVWTTENIEHYKQASMYTAFHKKLAVLITPFLSPEWTVADIGCGLAALDFEIASFVRSIDAIDPNQTVINDVEQKITDEIAAGRPFAARIRPQWADPNKLGDAMWDVVLLNFFGADGDTLADYLAHATKRAIVIVHGRAPNGKFDALCEVTEPTTAAEVEAYLERIGCRYRKNIVELPFGQPFKSIEDIHRFLDYYSLEEEPVDPDLSTDPEKLILSVEDRIIKTDRYDYPYYLPKNISVGIFVVIR